MAGDAHHLRSRARHRPKGWRLCGGDRYRWKAQNVPSVPDQAVRPTATWHAERPFGCSSDDMSAVGFSARSAGVCAPAVKDFATVRNRSAHTIEDAQPRSQTVMNYANPPRRLGKRAGGSPSGARISHPPLPAATSGSRGAAAKYGQRPWLTFPRAQIPLDALAATDGMQAVRAMPGSRKTTFTPPGLCHDGRKLRGHG
jgi:hypothetical protein